MPANQSQRPRFYEEQYLGAADLTAAVEYSRIQQACHALGAHTWGIAIGLQLKETPQPNGAVSVHVLPGYAWDGYGRPIVVLSPYKIPEEKFSAITFDAGIDTGDGEKGRLIPVWLRYDESATQNPRPGFEVCETADQRSRIQETFRIEIGHPGTTGRYTGITVAAKSLQDAKTALRAFDPTAPLVYDESIPQQTFPESQDRARWLIPIGYVRWLPVPTQPGHFVARDDKGVGGQPKDSDQMRIFRRYIGVVTEHIEAADGAIRLRDRAKDPKTSFFQAPLTVTDPQHPPTNDLVWVEGHLRVEGDVRIAGGTLDFRYQDGQDFTAPLKIQRVGDPASSTRALQVIIGRNSQTNNRLAVGPLEADNTTVDEKFVVLSGGNVGIGTSAPTLNLEIRGTDFGRNDGPATLHLFGARIGDTGGTTLFLKAFSGGVVAFDGPNNRVGVGTNTPVSKLEINGDLALQKLAPGVARALPADATMCWNDGTWLRLNENLDFSQPVPGVRTGGVLAPDSLNVGGAGGFGNPGTGNVWVKGNVGIGTIAPLTKLHVLGNRIRLENDGKHVDIRADGSFLDLHSETNHLYVRSSGPGGNNNVIINPFLEDGNVGIGTETPIVKLHVQGSLRVENDLYVVGQALKRNGPTWTVLSDERLKENINPLKDALSKLLQMHGVSFFWRSSGTTYNVTGQQMGLIAQQVETVFPEWVSTTPDGYKALTMNGFEALTIEALRELHAEIETLKIRLDKLTESQPAVDTRPRQRRGR